MSRVPGVKVRSEGEYGTSPPHTLHSGKPKRNGWLLMNKNETREEYNARMNTYMKNRYDKRRALAIELLGGKCVDCHVTEQLEFDHVRQEEKSFPIGRRMNSAPWEVILEELEKCVLRCESCHAYHTAFQKLKTFDALGLASRL